MGESWSIRQRGEARRCAICHDELSDPRAAALARCGGCGTAAHIDCFDAEGGCPTLGCGSRRPFADEEAGGERHRRLSIEGDGLFGPAGGRRRERQVERRVVRIVGLKRVFEFLKLGIDDVINDPAARRRVRSYYKVQRSSERAGDDQRRRSQADYQAWLDAHL